MILSKEQIISLRSSIISIGYQFFGNDAASFVDGCISDERTHLLIFGHFENGVIAGFLILSEVMDEAEIIQVAVKNDLSGKGIGTVLVKDAVEYCRNKGVGKIFLEVRVSNLSAEKIYLKNGFEKVGIRRLYYSDPVEDALIMSKSCCGACR